MIFASYAGRDRINGTVRVLFKTRLIFSRINGPNDYVPVVTLFSGDFALSLSTGSAGKESQKCGKENCSIASLLLISVQRSCFTAENICYCERPCKQF